MAKEKGGGLGRGQVAGERSRPAGSLSVLVGGSQGRRRGLRGHLLSQLASREGDTACRGVVVSTS